MNELTTYENKFDAAVKNNKILFYDYLNYKMHIGWTKDFNTFKWNKTNKTKSAIYVADFIEELPDFYFLGISIKDLVKRVFSNGFCYPTVLALSLCFSDFKIGIANLTNYISYYKKNIDIDCNKFEHCFLIIDCDTKTKIIDTSWGIITDYDTYNEVMNLENIKIIEKNQIIETSIYKFLNENKYNKQISKEKIEELLFKYTELCNKYTNPNNKYLEFFFNKRLLYDLGQEFNKLWLDHIFNNSYDKFLEYPKNNMFSLVDEKIDNFFDIEKCKGVK